MEALEDKNRKKDNVIALLEERVKLLEDKNPESKTFAHTGSQTEDEDILFCQVCDYPADDLFSLGEHVGEFHSEKVAEDMDCNFCDVSFPSQVTLTEHKAKNHHDEEARQKQPNSAQFTRNKWKLTCKYCEQNFELKSDLLKHSKLEHTKSVSVCWNFEAGCCEYEDSFCWFAHEKSRVNMRQYNLNCNICDLTFKSRPEYMKHRKLCHINILPECKNNMEGVCQYGDKKCWFKHSIEKYDTTEQNEGEKIEYKEVVGKLFDIVEKMTERLANLEKTNSNIEG